MSRVCFVAVLATVILSCHGDSHVSDIRLPPEIVSQGKKHIYYRPDGDETLPCEAKGNPTPLQYEWLRNGEHLDLDRFMSIDGGNLVFRALNSLHEGYYQCKARNQYGTALSNVTFLQRAVMGTFPPTTDHTEYRGTVGHPLQIPCDHFGGVPRPEISWQIVNDVYDYQSVPLALDRRKSIDEDGTLYFAHLTIDDHLDGKVYKCVTRNNELDLHQGGSYSIVEVEDYPGPAPAMSNLHATRNVVGFVGGNVTLKCIFSGSPTPRVTWTDSRGISLPLGRRQELTAYGTELMITDLTKGDEGTYTCLGNQEGGCESDPVQIILQVQAAPQFPEDSRPINVNKTEGEDHTFRCNATGEPQPDIQWFVNGDANFYDPKIAVNGEELTIRNLCKDCGNSGTDLKTVQCNASNIHGYVFASAYLNVLQRTQVIVSPESFTYTTNVHDHHELCLRNR